MKKFLIVSALILAPTMGLCETIGAAGVAANATFAGQSFDLNGLASGNAGGRAAYNNCVNSMQDHCKKGCELVYGAVTTVDCKIGDKPGKKKQWTGSDGTVNPTNLQAGSTTPPAGSSVKVVGDGINTPTLEITPNGSANICNTTQCESRCEEKKEGSHSTEYPVETSENMTNDLSLMAEAMF